MSARVAPARMLESAVFGTGGIVLALEVLASRIMTPYFGVSLYIWTSILATTLVFLALGYAWGGRVSRRAVDPVATYFHWIAWSAAAITLTCFVYPVLLPVLTGLGLVLGSLVASTVLLALPLILLAGLNPLLVAIRAAQFGGAGEPAGRVFFLSTLGSVAGVLVTAFVVIPWLANFDAMLVLAVMLAALAAYGLWRCPDADGDGDRTTRLLLIVTVVAAGALLLGKESYLRLISDDTRWPYEARIRAEHSSAYGNVKVVEVVPRGVPSGGFLAYVQDGLLQNRVGFDGTSYSPYTYVLEALAVGYSPGNRALVLGLGAGIVPRTLQRAGGAVTVVEINPDALAVARDHFGFEPERFDLAWEDARTYIGRCENRFDVAVVDLFQGDMAPEHLFSFEFFRDLSRCLGSDGVVVMNTFLDVEAPEASDLLRATLASVFDHVIEYRMPSGNGFLVGTDGDHRLVTGTPDRTMPESVAQLVRSTLLGARDLDITRLRGIAPISDDRNMFNARFAAAQMKLRRDFSVLFPLRILLN